MKNLKLFDFNQTHTTIRTSLNMKNTYNWLIHHCLVSSLKALTLTKTIRNQYIYSFNHAFNDTYQIINTSTVFCLLSLNLLWFLSVPLMISNTK